MKEIFQHIIFPSNGKLKDNYELYYRSGSRAVQRIIDGKDALILPEYTVIGFNTYFNGCSNYKWKKYTDISEITLNLDIEGEFTLRLYGYNLKSVEPERRDICEQFYSIPKRERISVNFDESSDQMLAFEIETESKVIVYGGSYAGEFNNNRDINLAISTTTCKKEQFIIPNVKALSENLLEVNGDIASHLYIHVVDNGRTLKRSDFPESNKIYLHPNKNTGGAGGFARGMMECMHQEDNITHVLLMDDDVMIQPESVNKTYILLKHLKNEYKNSFISGAMLYMEQPAIQKEDIGTVQPDATFIPLKHEFDHSLLRDNLKNEKEYPLQKHSYAAWWYCCIPMSTIKDKGLPLPVFVRGDDVEYGLRCKPGFITMNGICVWHMGFAGKFNVGMDHYQVNRNLMIDQSVSGVLDGVDIIRKAESDFRKHILRFDYDSAEIAVKAIEDYLKGPDFIAEDNGEKILIENNKLGHNMQPLDDFGNVDVNCGDPYEDLGRNIVKRVLFRLTDNGQKFWPFKYDESIMSVPYNDCYTPYRIAFRKNLIAVNPENRTGYKLERDNNRYRELIQRYKKAIKEYKRNNENLKVLYSKRMQDFTSEDFWMKYLEL